MEPSLWIFLCLISIIPTFMCAPVKEYVVKHLDVTTKEGQMDYLRRFGYLPEELENIIDLNQGNGNSKLTQAIKHFQEMAAIPQTGVLDNATIEMMKLPRCGVRDDEGIHDNSTRHKRYALHGSRWAINNLFYKITTYTNKLSREVVDREIARAFKAWSDYSQLEFTQVYNGFSNIDVRFARGYHGDEYPFDGVGNVLAHAFYPFFGGQTHLDDDELWTDSTARGSTNLFRVIVHELGHALGLRHSKVPTAVMYEFYKRDAVTSFRLDPDDIYGIQALYGAPVITQGNSRTTRTTTTQRPTLPTQPPVRPTGPEYCHLKKLDAVTRYDDGHDYAFAGQYYYKLGSQGVVDSPRKISERLLSIPDNIDSALYWDLTTGDSKGVLYIFKNSLVWWITSNRLHGPRTISEVFPGIPNNIDASFIWGGNGRTYFFKGKDYYRLALGSRVVDAGYPKPLAVWNLNGPIDSAALISKGDTYFFKGTEYYRYSGTVLKNADPSPKFTTVELFNCHDSASLKESHSQSNSDSTKEEVPVNEQHMNSLGEGLVVAQDGHYTQHSDVLGDLVLPSSSASQEQMAVALCFIVATAVSLCL